MTNNAIRNMFPRSAFVGFDHLLDDLDRVARHANDNYPPHNIVKIDDETYSIELAVAGFSINDLDIEVKDRKLSVSGEQGNRDREYIHRGISAKKFHRTFQLSEHVEVAGADMVDGILSIELKVVLPEEKRPRKIEIQDQNKKAVLLTE
jgi:molecular chaperone IbpA